MLKIASSFRVTQLDHLMTQQFGHCKTGDAIASFKGELLVFGHKFDLLYRFIQTHFALDIGERKQFVNHFD